MRPQLTTLMSMAANALFTGSIVFIPSAALAQTTSDSDFRATIYGFMPSLGASANFSTPVGSDINVDKGTLLDNTDFAIMGAFEGQKGRWGGFGDFMYFNVSPGRTMTRDLAIDGVPLPVNVTANAEVDIKASVLTMAGNFRAVSSPKGVFDVFGGVRMLDVRATLDYDLSANIGPFVGPSRAGRVDAEHRNWDGVGGAKGRVALGSPRIYALYYGDVGAGDSDLTWQVMGGVGVAFKHVDLLAAWRYLDYELKPEAKLQTLTLNGPAIGASFHW